MVRLPPRLSEHQLFVLEMAGAIVAGRASALDEHELEVLAEANRLLGLHGREAPITEAHWAVIGRTVATLLAAGARPDPRAYAA
jgi:hypothetical protein